MDVMTHFWDVNFRRMYTYYYCPPTGGSRRGRSRPCRECFLFYISGLVFSAATPDTRAYRNFSHSPSRARAQGTIPRALRGENLFRQVLRVRASKGNRVYRRVVLSSRGGEKGGEKGGVGRPSHGAQGEIIWRYNTGRVTTT